MRRIVAALALIVGVLIGPLSLPSYASFVVPTSDGDQGVVSSISDKIVGANKYSLAFALAVLAGLVFYLKRRADKDSIEL